MSVGFRVGCMVDGSRPDWDGAGPRPIAWAAWYPAEGNLAETALSGDGPAQSWFHIDPVVQGAPLREAGGPWPIVVISHGTGGSALSMAFTDVSRGAVEAPVVIFIGGPDLEAPVDLGGVWLKNGCRAAR